MSEFGYKAKIGKGAGVNKTYSGGGWRAEGAATSAPGWDDDGGGDAGGVDDRLNENILFFLCVCVCVMCVLVTATTTRRMK